MIDTVFCETKGRSYHCRATLLNRLDSTKYQLTVTLYTRMWGVTAGMKLNHRPEGLALDIMINHLQKRCVMKIAHMIHCENPNCDWECKP